MTSRVSAAFARGVTPSRLVAAALACLFMILLLGAVAVAPYLFAGATLQTEIAAQLRATTGLVISTRGTARFELLPRPHVALRTLHIADPSGTLTIDSDALDGDVRLLPLLAGHLELSAATLTRPRLVVDLDGRPMRPDSTIGRAMHPAGKPVASSERRLGTVTLVDGSAVLKSSALHDQPSFDHVDVTLDWRNLDSPATLTGSLTLRDTAADVAAWIAQPSSLMRGEPSAVALQIHSPPLDMSANGNLENAAALSFKGNLSASSPSLPKLLALGGVRLPPLAPFADLGLGGEATLTLDREGRMTLDLAGLRLHLDGNEYEGILAFQRGATASLSGTLATERLTLTPFLERAPKLGNGGGQWSHEPLQIQGGSPLDLDLRISATHLLATPLTIDDGALAIMTRNGRTEVALVEGKAYGGALKARMSVGVSPNGLSLRGSASLTEADAASLSWDAFGRQLAAGTLSASCSIETSGDSPAALMAHLQGSAKGHASDGEVSGIDLAGALRAAQGSGTVMQTLRAGRTPFAVLSFALRVTDGVAAIEQAAMSGTEAALTLAGSADVGARNLDLQATAAQPSGVAAPGTYRPLGFGIKGTFDRVIVFPGPNKTP